jgi:hypothetical protein
VDAILRKKSAADNDTEWKPLAVLQTAVNLSASVVGTAAKHCGFGATAVITPTASGKVMVRIIVGIFSTSGGAYFSLGAARFGTGAAPGAGAAATGTAFGNAIQSPVASAAGVLTYAECSQILTLAVGTQYWFDLVMQGSNAAATANAQNAQVIAIELP